MNIIIGSEPGIGSLGPKSLHLKVVEKAIEVEEKNNMNNQK